ncbi:hypothetical protein BVRB_5g112840 [Beta vulgaris subsp. vulgaris]|uniref:TPD1 protein homolog 1 n=1 Tax=Beta vulgaris subsp. vulgaris TaxID=3555 RepID=UPI00053F3418|nr:TPD1 protein homolog 1 [Beta vulgaris subsp. vulgaris]KMT10948.1 hypothetical protein BVRB_5g112840 [Beta vulgaris subsp. vulgaris]
MCMTWRRIAVVTALFSVLLFITVLPHSVMRLNLNDFQVKRLISSTINDVLPSPHRKLLSPKNVDKPNRFWGDTNKCSESDILVNQGPGAPLPSGIPTYTVEILNACVSGCDISQIHLHCGWFSSAHLVDPLIFKRIHFNDCLVNAGRALLNGQSITFQYANTYSYPLYVSSMSCL